MIEEAVAATVVTVVSVVAQRLLDVRQFVGVADARLLNDRHLRIAAVGVVNARLFKDRHIDDHVESLRLNVGGGVRLLNVHIFALVDVAPTSFLN